MPKSNYLETEIVEWLGGTTFAAAPSNIYVALSTADPTEDGSGLAEPSGGYSRQEITLGTPSQGANALTASNSAEIAFGPATGSWGTVTHFAVFDASSGGNMLYYAALDTSRAVGDGDSARFSSGQLTLGEQ